MRKAKDGKFIAIEFAFRNGKEPIVDSTSIGIASLSEDSLFREMPYEDTLFVWGKECKEKVRMIMSSDSAAKLAKALLVASETCEILMRSGGSADEVSEEVKARYNL